MQGQHTHFGFDLVRFYAIELVHRSLRLIARYFFYQSHNKLKSSSSATVFVIIVILYYHRGSFSPVTFVYEISLPVGECSITPPPLELIQLIHFNCTYLS